MPSEQLLQHRLPAGRRLRRGKIPFQPCSPTHRWGFAPRGSFAAEKHRARDQVWSRRDGFMSFTWQKETPWWVPVPCSLPEAEGRAGHGSTSSSPGFWHSQVVLNQLIPASLFDAVRFHPPGAMIPPLFPASLGAEGYQFPQKSVNFVLPIPSKPRAFPGADL